MTRKKKRLGEGIVEDANDEANKVSRRRKWY